MSVKSCILLLFSLSVALFSAGQGSDADSLIRASASAPIPALVVQKPIPASLVGTAILVGASPMFFEPSYRQNLLIREEMQLFRRNSLDHRQLHFDNELQFLPVCSVVGLKLLGVRSPHSLRQLCFRSASTMIAQVVLVQPIKKVVDELRPDRSALTSFPSGHTAFAFAGAELLRLEYSETSPLIPVVGYLVATLTGVMRIYNDRHWAGDVLAGAAIGFVAADLSWLLNNWLESKYPFFNH